MKKEKILNIGLYGLKEELLFIFEKKLNKLFEGDFNIIDLRINVKIFKLVNFFI